MILVRSFNTANHTVSINERNENVIKIYQKIDNPTPLNKYTKKLIDDPHQGLLITIHVGTGVRKEKSPLILT